MDSALFLPKKQVEPIQHSPGPPIPHSTTPIIHLKPHTNTTCAMSVVMCHAPACRGHVQQQHQPAVGRTAHVAFRQASRVVQREEGCTLLVGREGRHSLVHMRVALGSRSGRAASAAGTPDPAL